ncbi:MAG: hypothetical protein IT384_16790 [Deltaproteobacteria bacterium]|nr:hypothetical protein [Deltaproteobacteria bacterium]
MKTSVDLRPKTPVEARPDEMLAKLGTLQGNAIAEISPEEIGRAYETKLRLDQAPTASCTAGRSTLPPLDPMNLARAELMRLRIASRATIRAVVDANGSRVLGELALLQRATAAGISLADLDTYLKVTSAHLPPKERERRLAKHDAALAIACGYAGIDRSTPAHLRPAGAPIGRDIPEHMSGFNAVAEWERIVAFDERRVQLRQRIEELASRGAIPGDVASGAISVLDFQAAHLERLAVYCGKGRSMDALNTRAEETLRLASSLVEEAEASAPRAQLR